MPNPGVFYHVCTCCCCCYCCYCCCCCRCCRYWHYLARQLGEAVKQLPDVEYQQHIINAFHQRAKEMDVGLLKLALFLSPRYRQAALKTSDSSAAGSSSGSSSGSAAARQAAMLKLQSVAGKLAQ